MGDPVLRGVASEITDFDEARMLAGALREALRSRDTALAVAAPQIGRGQQAFIYDMGNGAGLVFNPRIQESKGSQVGEEGCLSIPGIRFTIERAHEVTYTYLDKRGREREKTVSGLEARMVQHEIDHLNGVLAIDLVPEEVKRKALYEWATRQSQ